jgi:hypothetical protein
VKELGIYLVIALVIVGAGFGLGTGGTDVHLIVIPLLVISVSYLIGRMMSVENDARYLAPMFALGAAAKMIGSVARHWVLMVQYRGIGDAVGYHNRGLELADSWREGVIPAVPEGLISFGTRFTGWFTGLVYAPYEPSLQGGFFLFGALALFGQFLFYAAYRRWAPPKTHFRYLALILFWPTLVYWPSSIGKEAFLMPFIGLAAYAASRLFERYGFGWIILFGAGAGLVFVVREHVTALMAVALMGTLFASKAAPGTGGRRVILVLVMVGAMIPVAAGLNERFGVSFEDSVSSEDFDGIRDDLERATGQGGSAVSGGVVRGPLDLPGGFLKVLYRPLPNEASNTQMLIASFEGTALLLLTLWTAPRWLPTLRKARSEPYLLFCIAYTMGFVIAWSWILNLGILARQRSLVIPFLLVIFAYGWYDKSTDEPEKSSEPLSLTA